MSAYIHTHRLKDAGYGDEAVPRRQVHQQLHHVRLHTHTQAEGCRVWGWGRPTSAGTSTASSCPPTYTHTGWRMQGMGMRPSHVGRYINSFIMSAYIHTHRLEDAGHGDEAVPRRQVHQQLHHVRLHTHTQAEGCRVWGWGRPTSAGTSTASSCPPTYTHTGWRMQGMGMRPSHVGRYINSFIMSAYIHTHRLEDAGHGDEAVPRRQVHQQLHHVRLHSHTQAECCRARGWGRPSSAGTSTASSCPPTYTGDGNEARAKMIHSYIWWTVNFPDLIHIHSSRCPRGRVTNFECHDSRTKRVYKLHE